MPATHSIKVGTEAFLPLGNITFSFIYTLSSFGNWIYQLLQFCKWNFAHSWCVHGFSCSTVRGRCCPILLFMMHHTFSIGDRSGLQAGQSSTHTLCLRRHAVVTCTEWSLTLSCWNRHGVPGKSISLDGSICLPSQRLFFALFVGNSLDGLFHLLHIESDIHLPPQKSWNVILSDQRTCFCYGTLYYKGRWGKEWGPRRTMLRET